AHAVPSGAAVRSPVREGRDGTRARLPAWCARLSVRRRLRGWLRPAPTPPILRRSLASKREEKAVTSGRSGEYPATGDPCRRAFGHHLGPPNCRSVRACAVKPCAFGAPLTRLWGLTARHGQTRGIRALMEIPMP